MNKRFYAVRFLSVFFTCTVSTCCTYAEDFHTGLVVGLKSKSAKPQVIEVGDIIRINNVVKGWNKKECGEHFLSTENGLILILSIEGRLTCTDRSLNKIWSVQLASQDLPKAVTGRNEQTILLTSDRRFLNVARDGRLLLDVKNSAINLIGRLNDGRIYAVDKNRAVYIDEFSKPIAGFLEQNLESEAKDVARILSIQTLDNGEFILLCRTTDGRRSCFIKKRGIVMELLSDSSQLFVLKQNFVIITDFGKLHFLKLGEETAKLADFNFQGFSALEQYSPDKIALFVWSNKRAKVRVFDNSGLTLSEQSFGFAPTSIAKLSDNGDFLICRNDGELSVVNVSTGVETLLSDNVSTSHFLCGLKVSNYIIGCRSHDFEIYRNPLLSAVDKK